mmetsp:Transcript_28707/g.83197  ORF Transcript_28707/g.83197 Transcript_28707/m.83197 type:complete len:1473 (-) Transcript_28707:109-4527(-)
MPTGGAASAASAASAAAGAAGAAAAASEVAIPPRTGPATGAGCRRGPCSPRAPPRLLPAQLRRARAVLVLVSALRRRCGLCRRPPWRPWGGDRATHLEVAAAEAAVVRLPSRPSWLHPPGRAPALASAVAAAAAAAAGDGGGDDNNSHANSKDGEATKADTEDGLVSTEADETAIINQFMAEVSGEMDDKAKRVAEKEREDSAAAAADSEDSTSSSAANEEKKKGRPQRTRRKPRQPQTARFMAFDSDDEAELIELVRRTAELVVQGERAASAALGRAEKMNANNGDEQEEDPMAEYDAHQAVFECFCEREGLRTIVRLTTGEAFQGATAMADKDDNDTASSSADAEGPSSSTKFGTAEVSSGNGDRKAIDDRANGGDDDDNNTVLLPPMSIATQAVQSVSILLQNVVRVTSLYYLMSNNRVNDLINLPLNLYRMAEDELRRSAAGGSRRNVLRHQQSSSAGRDASAEMAELTTHFVSFLKSLAMRMNEETLQFFLTYPELNAGTGGSKNGSRSNSGSSLSDLAEQTAEKLTVDTAANADADVVAGGPITPTAGDGNSNSQSIPSEQPEVQDVKFPLYARTLQFCSKDQDSFVRVTAMNICLNTLRIAVVSGDEDTDSNESMGPSFKSPDAALHKSAALPLRERMAIARYVCVPARVESLVSPIFMKLGHLCGAMSESIRNFDELDAKERRCIANLRALQSGSEFVDDQGRTTVDDILNEMEQFESKRQRLSDTFRDLGADLQDELLLLEDLLKVGLTSVNEQTIEMMLATFIYPLLMQPLSLFMQRKHPTPPGSTEDVPGVATSDEEMPEMPQNPFSSEDSSGYGSPSAKSTSDPDSAPAKTALFLASAVFHTITNKPLLHLLLTALFHPLAPVSEGGLIVKAKPEVLSRSSSTSQVGVRADSDASDFYAFGKNPGHHNEDDNKSQGDGDQTCVFVLAPALSNVFQSTVDPSHCAPETKENPYRRAMLACLGGTDGMSALQALAFFTTDAAFSTMDQRFTSKIILGAGIKSPTTFVGNYVLETISSLCVGVMTATLSSSHEIWNLEFNPFATNALLHAATCDEMAHSTASKLVQHRVRQSKACLAQLPDRIENSMPSFSMNGRSTVSSKSSDTANDARLDLITDQLFFDPHLMKEKSIVESLGRGSASTTDGKPKQSGPCFVPVTQKSSLDDVSSHVCRKPVDLLAADDVLAPIRSGARSAFAHLKIDAFSRFFSGTIPSDQQQLTNLYGKMSTGGDGGDENDDEEASYDGCSGPEWCIFAPLDDNVASLLLDEEKDSGNSGGAATNSNRYHQDSQHPQPGSVVGLVGRAAFPCVCEVAPESSSLFTDKGACVVAEGIKWQSLYLVILGKYMILAEPEKGGSGGNGRVVSSCGLACLRAEKDDPPAEESASPARRLLLSFASSSPTAPGVFIRNDVPFGATRNTVRLTRSRMDLWFEDETAAGHAFKVLSAKIMKARSRRGHFIQQRLGLS